MNRMPSFLSMLAQVNVPYRPFIDPVQLHEKWWFMLFPMALGIAIVYKAVRVREVRPDAGGVQTWWRQYAVAVGVMTVQIIAGMAALAVGSYLLVEVFARHVAERVGG